MAVEYVGAGVRSVAVAADTVPPLPTGLGAGHLMWLVDHVTYGANVDTAPAAVADWVLAGSAIGVTRTDTSTTGRTRLAIYRRFWQAGDAAPTVPYSGGTAGGHVSQVFAASGADPTNPILLGPAVTTAASTSQVGPITGVAAPAGSLVAVIAAASNNWAANGNTNVIGLLTGDGLTFTELTEYAYNGGEDLSQVVQLAPVPTATTVTAKTFTGGTWGQLQAVARMVVIRAADDATEPVPAVGERINLITRPSFEVGDLTGWVARRAGTTTALSLSLENGGAAAPAPFGAFYAFHTPGAGGDVEVEHAVVPVTAAVSYSGSIHVHRAQTGPVRAFLDWFSVSGALLGSAGGATVSVTAGTWTRVHTVGVAPTGAVTARVRLLCTDQTGNGVRVDAALLERGTQLRSYFDGATAGAMWDGTPHASTSRYTELLWVGDLETGDLSQFDLQNGGDREPPNEVIVVTSPVRAGGFARRSTVSATTTQSSSGQQRAETETGLRDVVEGDDLWFAESIQLLPGFSTSPGTFQLVTQWKNYVGGSPPLALHVEGGNWELQGGFGYPGGPRSMPSQDLGPAVTGQWTDWLWHIRFREGPDAGTVSIWRNGVQLVTDYVPPGGTLYPNSDSYLKIGLYRGTSAPVPASVVHDEMRVGLTRTSVEIDPLPPAQVTGAGWWPFLG